MQNANYILDRLKKARNITYDVELAELLGKDPSTIATWRRRNSVDHALILAKCHDLNANYIFYGDGHPLKQADIIPDKEKTQVEDQKECYNTNLDHVPQKLFSQMEAEINELKGKVKLLQELLMKKW